MTIGFGEWSEEEAPYQRLAMAIEACSPHDEIQMGITDFSDSLWRNATWLGIGLSRTIAIEIPLNNKIFEVADFIVLKDERVTNHLDH